MPENLQKTLRFDVDNERYFSLRQRGILFLDDEIDEGTFGKFCRDLAYLASGGSDSLETDSKKALKPIWVILNSPGGDVFQGMGIYDFIKGLVGRGVEINILSCGIVASMATAILQAATKRFSLPHTRFLVHQISKVSFFEVEEVNKAKEGVDELQKLNKVFLGIIAERTGMNPDDLHEKSKKFDYWLNPQEAKELGKNGLIDEIITALPF